MISKESLFGVIVAATVRAHGRKELALNHLLGQFDNPNPTVEASGNGDSSVSMLNHFNIDNFNDDIGGGEASSSSAKVDNRDVEMEDELIEELQRGDALSDYDIEVTKESEAINSLELLEEIVDHKFSVY